MPTSITSLLLTLVCLVLLMVLGLQAARLLAPGAMRLEAAAASFPLGAGLFTFVVFVLSWAGLPIRPISLAGVSIILLVLLTGLLRSRRGPVGRDGGGDRADERVPGDRLARWLTWGVLGALAGASMVIAVGRSYTPWDAAAVWAPKGYGMALEGTLFAAEDWGAHGLSYPLHIPLLISLFQVVGGEVLPGSKLVFPLYFASTLVGAVGFFRKVGMSYGSILPAVIVLGTVPVFFRHSTYGYVNIPVAAYVVLGSLWAVLGVTSGNAQRLAVGGALLAFSTWTTVEGIFYALAVVGALWVAGRFLRRGRTSAVPLLAPILIVGGTWLIFYLAHGIAGSQSGGAMGAARDGWRDGDLQLASLRLIFGYFRRSVFDVDTWGLLFPLCAVLLGLHWRRVLDRSVPELPILVLVILGTALATAAKFYGGSYATDDLLGWLTRGFPRAFFPSAFLLVILAFAALASGAIPAASLPEGEADRQGLPGKAAAP